MRSSAAPARVAEHEPLPAAPAVAQLVLVPPLVEPALPSRRELGRIAVNLLAVAATALVVVLWAAYLRPQALGGSAGYVLVSGRSMWPHYHTGDLVLVERKSSYHVGQVIAYRVPKGDPMAGAQVIHRIIGGDAVHGFLVQGDNRTAPDVWRPTPQDIVGAKALRIPNALLVLRWLRSPLLLGLLAGCFVFAHLTVRDEKRA
ncbi:MAG TPA: signal peptidase I [Gaiellaceae bacterium]|nr:signal peptidase I [Gaiellaceae bacterium]